MRTARLRLPIVLSALIALSALAPMVAAQEPVVEPVPAPEPPAPAVILPGSTIAKIDVGGMTYEQAFETVKAQYAQQITLTIGKQQYTVRGSQLRARYAIKQAVEESLARTGVGNTPVGVEFDEKRLDRTVRRLLTRVGTVGSDPSWRIAPTPRIIPGKPGITASERDIRTQIVRALEDPTLRPGQEPIPLRKVRSKATVETLGYVVTISKNDLKLRLWQPKNGKATAVRTFRIAVGAPAYPTPRGRFTIVDKQRNPWWYPPDSPWAEGQDPVPPGPGNPLGTRWMGLDRDAIGIHGTPNAGSLGTYASHGCVRMEIGSAEWLFDRVSVGTPVLIH